ncbi:unnamed protein product [Diabrotica balteata]|uniref:Uncharacterized protein n=1 Tax=Diabrotica balteata TaxID=107213 RepID=A0A9N9T1S4_DIABA|nr:unnamed protein product [Diabrotica balteata]
MSEKKMDKKPSRTSILKPRKSINQSDVNDSNCEIVPARDARRVSFASSNFVKPFVADPEKNTIWDNTYEEEVNHTDSTSETKGFLDTNSVSALTFNDENQEVRAEPFFVMTQNTSVRSVSINTTKIDECNKENYVPSILRNPFVAEGSIHVNESVFKTETRTSEIQFTDLKGMQTQNQENAMDLTCMPNFPLTSNLFYTNTVRKFESDNKENIVDLKHIPIIPDNNLTNVLSTTNNTLAETLKTMKPVDIIPKVPEFSQNSEVFRKNQVQELYHVNTVACSDMQLTCTHPREDIPEKDFDNSEISMEITSDILVDESMKNVGNSGTTMPLRQIVSTNDNGNILERSLGNQEVNLSYSNNMNIDTSMQITCAIPCADQTISSNINDTKIDMDTSMQITCVYPESNKIVKSSVYASGNSEKSSGNTTKNNIDTSMQFTCVLPPTSQIISNHINDHKKNIDTGMQFTSICPETAKMIENPAFSDVGCNKSYKSNTNTNVDNGMQLTCVFPPTGQIISDHINDTKTDMDKSMQMTCVYPDTSTIFKNFADLDKEKSSESITSKNIDTSMQLTCVFPPTGQIISNHINNTKTDMDNNMEMTYVHANSKIIKNFTNVINEKSENTTSKNIDTSMQFTCVFPPSGQIISNNINCTKTDMGNNMQMTCIYPDTRKSITNFANVGNEESKSTTSNNIDTSMQFTCVFPPPGQIISNNINDTKPDINTSMQMTCIHPDTRKSFTNFTNVDNEKSKSTTSKNIDTSMQFTCVFPPSGQIISNNINDKKADMDNSMQMTCVHPDTSKIIKSFVNEGNEKPESITSKNIDTSMQFTCVFPPTDQILSNNVTDTKKDMDNSMLLTCIYPETGKINKKSAYDAVGCGKYSKSTASSDTDTSMQFTCVFPPTTQVMPDNISDIKKSSSHLVGIYPETADNNIDNFSRTNKMVPHNINHNNKEIDTSRQISCKYPESDKILKTSPNKNITTKTSEDNTNKSVDTNMQLTCVIPQAKAGISDNDKSYIGTGNCENSNMQLTNAIHNEIMHKTAVNIATDTSMVSKRNINGTLCDMTIDQTAGVQATLCDMSIDETHNLEGIAVTYVVSNDGTNQKIIDNPSKSECDMSIDETQNSEGIAVTYVVSNDGTNQKTIGNPSKNVTTGNGTVITDRVDNVIPNKQVNDERYFVPIKKTKFADELKTDINISYTDQQHTGVDEYKRKTQEKSLEVGTISKTETKKSCEEDNMCNEHKISTDIEETKDNFAVTEIKENMVSKIITRSRTKFLKFREEFNSAKRKQDNTTTNLTEIKDSSVLTQNNEEEIPNKNDLITPVEATTNARSKDLQFCEDFNLKKRVELVNNVAEDNTNANILIGSSHVVTRSKHALPQPSEEYNSKTNKVNNKLNNLEEDREINLITASGIVTRSRNKVLISCDGLGPKYEDRHKNDNKNIRKNSSCIQYLRGDHMPLPNNDTMDETIKTSMTRLTSSTDKEFPSTGESRLKPTEKEKIHADHLIIPKIQQEFGPNDTTLTVYESSLLKETTVNSNDYQNTHEAKSIISTNDRITNNFPNRASSAGKPAFSFDICRSSTLVNRSDIKDENEIAGTCNLNKEKIMRLNSDVLRIDDASSSFALMLSNSPCLEYPGKKIYSTCTRPRFSLNRDESTTEEYSRNEINPVRSNEEPKEPNANMQSAPIKNSSNTPKNKSLLLCDTSPIIVDMTIDDEYIQETEKSIIDKLETRLSNSFMQPPSEYSRSLEKLLNEFKQCLTMPKLEISEIDNNLIKKLDDASKKTEQLLENLNIYKRDVVDLEELDKLENFGSSSTSRFSDEILSADFVSNNTGEDTGWDDMTVSRSLEDKIKEAASRSEKYWQFVKADDEFYYFYTYYRLVPFKVKAHPDSGIVDKIYTYTNLIDNAKLLSCYNSKFLLEKLKYENLLLALGGKFDLLTLLDYVSICMEEVIDFSTEFRTLETEYGPTHKLRMNSESSVCVEILHIKYVIWWVITMQLSIHNLGSIDDIKASHIYAEVDEKQIQSLGKNFSGCLQLRNFIINLNQHVEKVGKRILAYRKNELLT